MARERVVVDTNVLISGLLQPRSVPARAVEHAVAEHQLVATTASLREFMRVLLEPKFDRYVSRKRREALLMRLAPLVEIVDVVQAIQACRDPRDDIFLEAAVNGRAEVMVTGDRDLLVLHPFRGVAILQPAAYLAR